MMASVVILKSIVVPGAGDIDCLMRELAKEEALGAMFSTT